MKRIILAALVLILSVPAFAFSLLFYRFTVRSNYVKAPISTDQLPTPTPTETPSAPTPIDQLSTIPPVEEELVEEIVVEEVEPGAEEDLDGEPGVENTPEEGREEEVEMSTEEIIEEQSVESTPGEAQQ